VTVTSGLVRSGRDRNWGRVADGEGDAGAGDGEREGADGAGDPDGEGVEPNEGIHRPTTAPAPRRPAPAMTRRNVRRLR